jgi:hypothetical protein
MEDVGIFYGNLVYFPRFGMLQQEKSGSPALATHRFHVEIGHGGKVGAVVLGVADLDGVLEPILQISFGPKVYKEIFMSSNYGQNLILNLKENNVCKT